MTVFGIPRDNLTFLWSDTELARLGSSFREKFIFVGGGKTYDHDTIMQWFNFTTSTNATSWEVVYSDVAKLFLLSPLCLILMCQVGWGMMQAGASRVESAATPFLANILTLGVSVLSVWSVGYAFARSDGAAPLGYSNWFSHDFESHKALDWLLHFCACVTTANIASSGGLERCPLYVHVIVTSTISGLLCGVVNRWTWHQDSWTILQAPLHGAPFTDLGGSGVIHVVGGSAALVATYMLGPRFYRIRPRPSKIIFNDLDGHSLPLEMLGWYLCFVCITCTNFVRATVTCITCSTVVHRLAMAASNSLVAGGASAISTGLTVHLLTNLLGLRRFHYSLCRMTANGALLGLVSVAAGCHVYAHWAAFVIGVTSTVGYVTWSAILYALRVDDPVGAVAVHLGGGLWGLACGPLFTPGSGLLFAHHSGRATLALLWNVLTGLLLAGCSAFVTGIALLVPRLLSCVPLSHSRQIHGMDMEYLGQQAYPDNDRMTPFNTDVIEDRERFEDSHVTLSNSPAPSVTSPISPMSLSLVKSPMSKQIMTLPPFETLDMCDIEMAARSPGSKSLPSFSRSPGYADRRVWFWGERLADQVAPATPTRGYRDEDMLRDVEF
ncbi:putative ammonium transporter 1 [Mya arenaria]|uniref:putative ammonium transporter 1 n=1 Tax=Mya arenaria TaxID=6604 RepID=UPI0022E6A394|nr:putative ammonium transporter 1 [Mya arenaria]